MKAFCIWLMFCVAPLSCLAQGTDYASPAIKTLVAGIVCAPETAGENPAPGTLAGSTHLVAESPPFVSQTRRVPAVLGIGFGVKAMVHDFGGVDGVVMTITHPPMGPSGATTQYFDSRISAIDPSLTFYQFDFDYELVTGPWQMEATLSGQVLYRVCSMSCRQQRCPSWPPYVVLASCYPERMVGKLPTLHCVVIRRVGNLPTAPVKTDPAAPD